jgi:hypothetical protein
MGGDRKAESATAVAEPEAADDAADDGGEETKSE